MSKTYVVTGGTGFIGAYLVRKLVSQGRKLRVKGGRAIDQDTVAAEGTIKINGVRNSASSMSTAVVTVVSPVRPPASTPEADSM